MFATCIERHRPPRGFTLLELITVMVLGAILAAVALPRLDMALGQSGPAWREQVLAALRHARTLSVGHRRLVCASIGSASITLSIASTNPASSCSHNLPGIDGHSAWARDDKAPATAGTPATLYFQPSGRVSSDGAGSTVVSATITISGQAPVSLVGETGHVQ